MLYKVLGTIVLAIDAVAAMVFVTLGAYLLPGDGADANVLGSLVIMALAVIVAVAVTVPTRMILRRRGTDLFEGVRLW
jgi:uncharacterized membrane protein YhaH (DUF805 family)